MLAKAAIEKKRVNSINNAFASNFAKSMFLSVLGLIILSFIGTRMFTHVDLNLYGYMVGTIVFLGGFFYRFISWGKDLQQKSSSKKESSCCFENQRQKHQENIWLYIQFHLE